MKRKVLLCLFAILLPAALAAQTAPASASPEPSLDAATTQALVRLGGQLMLAGKAYEYDRVLSDEIGPRLTGSPNYVKAAEWATAEFTKLGLNNVHREAWEIGATWEPEFATARILSPHAQRLHLESEGWSPSTPAGGVRGGVHYLKKFSPDGVKAESGEIKDAIVLIDRDSIAGAGPLLIGKALDTVAMIKDAGARALLLGAGDTNNVSSMIGFGGLDGSITALPVGNVGSEDTLLLRRYLDRGPVEVEFSFSNRTRDHVKVDNVIAEIPGSDTRGEYVLIGGHLDSWQLGTGAEDNGTGAASVLAVAEAVKTSGIQPRRTLRFVLFGGEEEGLLGSIHYAREHAAEMDKCAGVFITDTGAEPPKGWYTFGREDEDRALGAIKPLLASLGASGATDDGEFTFSTDHGPFLVHGVPSFVLWTSTEKYFKLHHKAGDTFDKVDERDLNLGAAVVGVTAIAIADAPVPMRHLSQTELEEQLKKIKSYDEYQDIVAHKMF